MADRWVIIQGKDGTEYGILESDFDRVVVEPDLGEDGEPKKSGKTYADLGYKILRYQDGEEYHPRARKKSD